MPVLLPQLEDCTFGPVRGTSGSGTLPRVRRHAAAVVVAIVAMPALLLSPLEAASPKRDYAAPAAAWSILPPGENGTLTFDRNTTDQEKLYDGLTPLRGAVTQRDLRRFFKPAPLGLGADKPRKRERPRAGVTIVRDSFGVAHVAGKTEVDVAFGAGWVTAADRGLLLQLIRGPARAAALDVPGLDPLALALSGRTFVPSADAEAFLSNQLDALRAQGATGRRLFAIVNAYAAGVNAWYRAKGIPAAPFTANDVVASTALIAGRFGANGGQEVENAMFLRRARGAARRIPERAGLRRPARLERSASRRCPFRGASRTSFRPPRRPEASLSTTGASPARRSSSHRSPRTLSWSRAKRSETGHPLFVAGPQVGYFFPQFFAEMELAGRGLRNTRRGLPGRPVRPHRARPRLRVERDLVAGGQHRSLRRDPLRRTTGTTSTAASASRCAASWRER